MSARWQRHEVCEGMYFDAYEAVGAQPGPSLTLIGGQHGMEPAGPALIAEFLHGLDTRLLRGTLRAVPMAFVEALRGGRECAFPDHALKQAKGVNMKWGHCPWGLNRSHCGRNLNRLWPGDPDGSPHQQLAAAIWGEVCEPAEYVIDFHCWADYGPPGNLCYDQAGVQFARQFLLGHHYLCPTTDPAGILTHAAVTAGKQSFTVELTPQNRITLAAAEQTRRGLVNVLRFLEMLPGATEALPEQYEISWRDDKPIEITLDYDAIIIPMVAGGAWCAAGQVIGTAVGLDDPSRVEPVCAPVDGVVNSTLERSMVEAGQNLFNYWPARRL